ncbi:MAG: M20/M25/M40 family metallo-hydrolase [Clostridia bacterium]|nr:M20/M25/M40 family metallo-hydrolase [Clostridia bacterium]
MDNINEFKILKDLVKFNTIKDKENKEIINYIESYLNALGFKTEYKTNTLVMSIGKSPKIGFLGHTDTVEYIDEFKTPFDLTLKDNYLYGLGACDMKGGIAAMLDAVSKVDFSKLQNGMKLYFTYDEEIGFGGTYELVGNKEEFPEVMIFGEPTNNEALIGGKGLVEYDINFKGLKAHSSNPDKGISANLNAVKFLYELEEFYNNEIKVEKEDCFEIPYTTMNVGIINGGTAKNSVPANCNVVIDFRTIKASHIDSINKKLQELSDKYKAEVSIIECINPFLNKIDYFDEIKTANFMTEASLIGDKSKRIILGTGPVTAHEVNENISVDSYRKLVKQYEDLINKVCK